jgi:hypothetical protein
MSLSLKTTVALPLILSIAPALSQTAAAPPKYDSQTETNAKGIIEEIKTFTLGKRADYTEAIVKSGDNKIEIYLSPKPFQDEMGINFVKGDEISVTGSRVKQEGDKQEQTSVILAREIIKGTDTLMFRDDKGKPVWDERTGK